VTNGRPNTYWKNGNKKTAANDASGTPRGKKFKGRKDKKSGKKKEKKKKINKKKKHQTQKKTRTTKKTRKHSGSTGRKLIKKIE